MSNVLRRIGQGLTSFGMGVPVIELERQALVNEGLETRNQINQEALAQAQRAPAERSRLIALRRAAATGNQEAISDYFAQNPDDALTMFKGMGMVTERQQAEAVQFAKNLRAMPFDMRPEMIMRRAEKLDSLERKSFDTRSLLDMDEATQNRVLDTMMAAGSTLPAELQTFEGLLESARSEDPDRAGAAQVELGLKPRAGTVSKEERIAEDPQTTADVASSQAEIKGATKAEEQRMTRLSGTVSAASDVMDQLPVLRRTRELLDIIDTGGRFREMQLEAKRFLGVEGADEGELSGNLGKAVLSQLRETFGAQFTEKEGERLERIEANFGKNTATNIRLIEAAIAMIERKVKRGLKAATDLEDQFWVDEFTSVLDVKDNQPKESRIKYDAQGNRID